LHGALLDAELLADVYLAMTRGQESLEIALHGETAAGAVADAAASWPPAGLLLVGPTDDEERAHQAYLEALARDALGPALWARLESGAG
ncbi:MAG: DNA polymerase III subunit epsilon, partial [Rubrivivax sp.]